MKKNQNIIHLLKLIQKQNNPNVFDFLNDEAIDCICECVFNVLYTDLKLPSYKKNKLKKFLKHNCSVHRLKKIASKKVPINKRRKALKMEGRGLGLILASAIPFLTNLIFGK